MILEILFFLSAFLCGYSYFIYPFLLILLPARPAGGPASLEEQALPRLSLIITVHNEAGRIRQKLENTLEIDYPGEKFEIIVASDCSTDDTERIVQSYAQRGIRLIRVAERRGKEYAQLCAVREAGGEILVFSDAATRIPADALRILAGLFSDDRVGAVSSEDRFISNDGRVAGEGAYVRYEMWLRRLESGRGGLVGLSGSFFAARREVCREWDIYSPSDFNTALNCAKQGLVAITSPEVHGIYEDIKDPRLEYRRKMRTVIRGLTAVVRHPEVLNPRSVGLFAFQVWSHKIMRWGVPWFLLLFALATVLLAPRALPYQIVFSLQAAFYAIALAAWMMPPLRDNAVTRLVFFFVQTNIALAHAQLGFLAGKRMTVWQPTQR